VIYWIGGSNSRLWPRRLIDSHYDSFSVVVFVLLFVVWMLGHTVYKSNITNNPNPRRTQAQAQPENMVLIWDDENFSMVCKPLALVP
jgi:hypothetical protein